MYLNNNLYLCINEYSKKNINKLNVLCKKYNVSKLGITANLVKTVKSEF